MSKDTWPSSPRKDTEHRLLLATAHSSWYGQEQEWRVVKNATSIQASQPKGLEDNYWGGKLETWCKWLIGTGVICFHFGNTATHRRIAHELDTLDLLSHCTYSEPIHLVSFYCVILSLFQLTSFWTTFRLFVHYLYKWSRKLDARLWPNRKLQWPLSLMIPMLLVSSMLNTLLTVGMMRIPLNPINLILALVLDPTLVLEDLALWNR